MAALKVSEQVFACYSASCRPPTAGGTGGSLPGKSGRGGGGGLVPGKSYRNLESFPQRSEADRLSMHAGKGSRTRLSQSAGQTAHKNPSGGLGGGSAGRKPPVAKPSSSSSPAAHPSQTKRISPGKTRTVKGDDGKTLGKVTRHKNRNPDGQYRYESSNGFSGRAKTQQAAVDALRNPEANFSRNL